MLSGYFRLLGRAYAGLPKLRLHYPYSTSNSQNVKEQMESLSELSKLMNKTPSTIAKQELLAKYSNCSEILQRIYAPHTRFWISSRAIKTFEKKGEPKETTDKSLSELLDQLSSRQLTGNNALSAACAFLRRHCNTPELRNIFFKVIDRNMRMGVSLQTINRVFPNPIPNFRVALAMPFKGDPSSLLNPDQPWYASRKLDGVRCLALATKDPLNGAWIIDCRSRTGRPFVSLVKVQNALREALSQYRGPDMVFDGEICVYDENGMSENFANALKQIKRLDCQMETPVYQIFDVIETEAFSVGYDETLFSKRLEKMKKLLKDADQSTIRIVPQSVLVQDTDLVNMQKTAVENGWEGIMLRKDCSYEGKRRYIYLNIKSIYRLCLIRMTSRNLLKVKQYEDSEYIVKSIETGYMRMPDTGVVEKVMTSVIIEHKGMLALNYSLFQKRNKGIDTFDRK